MLYRRDKDRLTVSQQENSEMLFRAAREGDLGRMKRILHDDMVGIADFQFIKPDVVLSTTLTAFLSACAQEEYDGRDIGRQALEGTVLLVEHGANIMATVHLKSNAIESAVRKDKLDVTNYLITAVSPLSGETLNRIMFCCDSAEMLQLLIVYGADIKSRGDDGATILMKINTNENRQRDIRRLALRSGVDVNAQCRGGTTALHEAAVYGDLPSVMGLCKAGASLDVKDRKGNTPLDTAILWHRQHWEMRDGREPPHASFSGTVQFLREEALRRALRRNGI